jgi:hypothetical protein
MTLEDVFATVLPGVRTTRLSQEDLYRTAAALPQGERPDGDGMTAAIHRLDDDRMAIVPIRARAGTHNPDLPDEYVVAEFPEPGVMPEDLLLAQAAGWSVDMVHLRAAQDMAGGVRIYWAAFFHA